MKKRSTIDQKRVNSGLSRRSFLKFCATTVSLLALPPAAVSVFASKLGDAHRLPVIWLSFQECTGCTESLTRSHAPTIEDLLFDYVSLDYHHTLQAASGHAAEEARRLTIKKYFGHYLLVVDGSVPLASGGACSTIAGESNVQMLKKAVAGAKAVLAIGSCAAFGGIAAASPNPTGARGVGELMDDGTLKHQPLVNMPGCPPIPAAISGVLAHYLAFDKFPELDELRRPKAIYGNTVHDRCSRLHFYEQGKFAESFDDEGARKGWCLYKLGCKGPVTHNACASMKWNEGTSFPVESGHPCIGCSEPRFWDKGGFYESLDVVALKYQPPEESAEHKKQEGQALYEDNCVFCHSSDPTQFRTAAEDIPEVLQSGSVRAHRRLEFSEDQLNLLKHYLKND